MPGIQDHRTVPAYTEQDQTGYQGYGVYQSADFVEGKGVKVTRCAAGSEVPYGVLVRGGEGASATNPLSVNIVKQGIVPVIAGTGDLAYGDWVGVEAGGQWVAKTTDGDVVCGRCVKGATDGSIALVDLCEPHTLSIPGI